MYCTYSGLYSPSLEIDISTQCSYLNGRRQDLIKVDRLMEVMCRGFMIYGGGFRQPMHAAGIEVKIPSGAVWILSTKGQEL